MKVLVPLASVFWVIFVAPLQGAPQRYAWVAEDGSVRVGERLDNRPTGKGCLVVWQEGHTPRWALGEGPGLDLATLLEESSGEWVSGKVETADLAAYVPEIRLARPPALSPLCWAALEALGFDRYQVDWSGGYRIGPLPAGSWEVTFSAPFHETHAVQLELTGNPQERHLPPVRLASFGEVRVEVAGLSSPASLLVKRVVHEPGRAPEYHAVATHELGPAQEPTLQLAAGVYLFQVEESGFLLGRQKAPVGVGEQVVRVAVSALRVVGTVKQGAEAVPAATLEVSADEDFSLTLQTDGEGRFRAVLPRPARYMVVAQLPDGRRQVVLWNLEGARSGEEVQRDLVVTTRWLKGKVVNQAGSPLPTARVRYQTRDADLREEIMGDVAVRPDGSFSVPLEENKSLQLHVGGVEGYLPASLVWPSSPPEEFTVVLEDEVDVRGVVVDGAGRPQTAAVAVVADLFETSAFRTRASSDGTSRLTTPRNAVLVAWTSGGVAWASAQERLELRLAPLGEPVRLALAEA